MKFDSFTIFVIILLLLVGFLMWNRTFSFREEGFVDFNRDNQTSMYIPQYSTDRERKVIHLYDNIYYDNLNGALIEVNGTQGGTKTDISGATITDIRIVSRNQQGEVSTVVTNKNANTNEIIPFDSPISLNKETVKLYGDYTYITETEEIEGSSPDKYKYVCMYSGWNTDTVLQLFKTNGELLTYIKSYLLTPTGIKNTITGTITPSHIQTDTNPEKYSYDESNPDSEISNYLANIQVKQVSTKVFYDVKNANIILKNSNGIKVLHRDGSERTVGQYNNDKAALTSGPVVFSCANEDGSSGLVLVTSFDDKTLVTVVIPISAGEQMSYKIVRSKRFNASGEVNSEADETPEQTTSTCTPAPTETPAPTATQSPFQQFMDGSMNMSGIQCGSDPSCWYWFFRSQPQHSTGPLTDDYFLKTEVVPPVCPQCPNCPGSGVCTDCGGNGGSGTTVNLKLTSLGQTEYKDSLGNVYISKNDASGNTTYVLKGTSDTAGGVSNNLVSTTGDVATNVIDSAENVLTKTGSGTTSLLRDTGSGTADFLKETGSGATNLLRDTASGTTDLLRDTASGTVDLLKDTVSGTADFLKTTGRGIRDLGQGSLQVQQSGVYGPQTQGQMYGQTQGQMYGQRQGQLQPYPNGGADNYSYYGAVPSKGGDYIPVTADFSSFRK